MAGGVDHPDLKLAQVEFVAFLQSDRGEQKSAGSAGCYLAAGLVSQFPGAGNEVVVNVGLEGVDDSRSVAGSDLDVLVNVTGGVDDDAPSGLFGADDLAVVGQAFEPYCFHKHYKGAESCQCG